MATGSQMYNWQKNQSKNNNMAQGIEPGAGEINDEMRALKNPLESTEWKDFTPVQIGITPCIHEHNTNETKIKVEVGLDGSGRHPQTGLGFLITCWIRLRHGKNGLTVGVNGDLHIIDMPASNDLACLG